jgi:hypothetical protein
MKKETCPSLQGFLLWDADDLTWLRVSLSNRLYTIMDSWAIGEVSGKGPVLTVGMSNHAERTSRELRLQNSRCSRKKSEVSFAAAGSAYRSRVEGGWLREEKTLNFANAGPPSASLIKAETLEDAPLNAPLTAPLFQGEHPSLSSLRQRGGTTSSKSWLEGHAR